MTKDHNIKRRPHAKVLLTSHVRSAYNPTFRNKCKWIRLFEAIADFFKTHHHVIINFSVNIWRGIQQK